MTQLSDLLQQGSANNWLFVPSAILLGALHGLEPGHSKTMMAAFIIAVRDTVKEVRHIDTGHGVLALEVFENGVRPRWQIQSL
jgi:ABC-type nickel/cobalt efflux system permease component RcnA